MPRVPSISTLDTNSAGLLNAIRNELGADYQSAVPTAEQTTESIRAVGTAILGYEPHRNAFLNALVNRIALVLVTSRSYRNPLAMFKRGVIELGESVEEIFVDLVNAHQFDPAASENTLYKRNKPDVKSMFHAMNYQKYYPITVSEQQLRTAFVSFDGLTNFVMSLVNRLYDSMYVDEYIMTKYVIAVLALNGNIAVKPIPDFTVAGNADSIVTSIKTVSNDMLFMGADYNAAGVPNYTPVEEQYFLMGGGLSANIDVNSLAKAFNLDYVRFVGQQVMVNNFGFSAFEQTRLRELLADDDSFNADEFFSANNMAALNAIAGGIFDRDFFMIFDNLLETRNAENGKGLYYNYFLHNWKTFSASPFQNACLFSTSQSEITSVSVSPANTGIAAANVSRKGKTNRFKATVNGTGYISNGVIWSITGAENEGTYIDQYGVLYVSPDETANDVSVWAESVQAPGVKGEFSTIISD